jgi:general secretion pathway protein G
MKKNGFTMVELIFVIVILGVLAAVAIPKLGATRDDAKISSEGMNVATALNSLAAEWTAKGAWVDFTDAMANSLVKCFTFQAAQDGNVTLAPIAGATAECPSAVLEGVKKLAAKNGLLNSDESQKIHQFGGTKVED